MLDSIDTGGVNIQKIYEEWGLYKKEDLPQVNPQLYKWLAIINDKSSNNIVPTTAENVNKNSSSQSDIKQRQLEIIKQTNPMWDDYHTGIRSVTFAAPVLLNGNIANVAVCVVYGKGKVHSLRVLTPEGKTFELVKIKKVGQTKVNSLKLKGSTSHSNYGYSIPNSNENVNKNSKNVDEQTNTVDDNDLQFSSNAVNPIDTYTETQYNNFGWVRANNVLTAAEYSTLLSRYADYKHNKDNYPTTRFGEAIIYSFDYPDVIMYVKGTIRSPEITKILKIDKSLPIVTQETIQKEILFNERYKVPLPYENVPIVFGEKSIALNKKRDFPSFQEYKRKRKGSISTENDIANRDKQDGTGSIRKNSDNSLEYSLPDRDSAEALLDRLQNGEITKDEYLDIVSKTKQENPVTIAQMKKEEANTTPELREPKRVGTGDKESKLYGSLLESQIITDEVKTEIANKLADKI